jgi:uncharacterized membrane protein YkvA (DUF1232 family)
MLGRLDTNGVIPIANETGAVNITGGIPMEGFEQLLREDIAGYAGDHQELIVSAPDLYRMFTRLLDDANLPGQLRPFVILAIGYFNLQADIMPEDLKGVLGYVDDIFFCAFIADRIRRELDSDEVLRENWEGQRPLMPLLEEILSKEQALIGDRRDLILWYTGYEYLPQ